MWFRAGSFPDDRFSVSTLKKRMRRKNKSEDKTEKVIAGSGDATDSGSGTVEPVEEQSEKNHHTWPKVVRPPRYKKSSSKTRLDGSKKILDTKTTTNSATIKNSKSNTNLNINTLIKNKLNNHKHAPAAILAKVIPNGESLASGPFPLVSSKSVNNSRSQFATSGSNIPGHKKYKLAKTKSRKNLHQQQQQQSKRSSISSQASQVAGSGDATLAENAGSCAEGFDGNVALLTC